MTPLLSSIDALVAPLTQAVETNAGGKAAVLATLLRLGLPVPEGMVLTVEAFDDFLNSQELSARIDQMLAAAGDGDYDDLSAAVRDLVMAAPLPPGVELAVQATSMLLSDGPVVVRSSAVGEDGRSASYAGQFDSVLHVTSPNALFAAVRTCWASCWSARAIVYRQTRRLPMTPMAVVVQKQVRAGAAGVLFTRAPHGTGAPADAMVVEYTAGLADGLVSGRIDPGRLFVGRQDRRVTFDADPEDANVRDLVERNASALAALGLHLEEALGGPQDVEWAIDDAERLWVVQSRPITVSMTMPAGTAVNHAPATLRESSGTIVWSNANVCENFPEPVSPLLYSIASAGYYHYFRNLGLAFGVSRRRLQAMDPAFRTIVGVHGARLYYNLTNIHTVLRLVPFGDRLTQAFNLFVGATHTTDGSSRNGAWALRRDAWRQGIEAAWMAVCVVWQFAFLERRLRRFERTADEYAARTSGVLAGRSLSDLGDDLAAFVHIRRHRWKNASLCDAAAMLSDALLGRLLRSAQLDDVVKTRLLRAIPGAPSSEPALQLWTLSRRVRHQPSLQRLVADSPDATLRDELARHPEFAGFARELDDYLATWGFRSSGELMLTHPTLEEQPAPAVALLRQYAATEGDDPPDAIRRQADARRAETRAVARTLLRRRPHLLLPFLALLRWTHRAIVARERARLKQALLYTRCRRVALAIGVTLEERGRLPKADDVFMLTWQELDEACAGRAMFPAGLGDLVQLRRTQHAGAGARTPPDTIVLTDGNVWNAQPLPDDREHASESTDHFGTGTELRGSTACGGRISARAAVLSGLHDSMRLTRGDVLVTRQTDPGWAAVFCLVSGLAIERGGLLSHGAIIAREFGLPCLVGVKAATSRIAHGATLTVDADRGVCRIEAAR